MDFPSGAIKNVAASQHGGPEISTKKNNVFSLWTPAESAPYIGGQVISEERYSAVSYERPAAGFTADYQTARVQFHIAARESGAALKEIILPGYKGPKGETLATDIAAHGHPDAPYAIITGSVEHGAEMHGSALQAHWLQQAETLAKTCPDVRFVHVHALNPFGFAHVLRGDQNGVDVCRNFIGNFSAATTPEAYPRFAGDLVPPHPGSAAYHLHSARLYASAWRQGENHFRDALTYGQTDFPGYPYYTGKTPCWSHQQWQAITAEFLGNAEAIIHLSQHSGFGPYSHTQIMYRTAGMPDNGCAAAIWPGEHLTSPDTPRQKDTFVINQGDILGSWAMMPGMEGKRILAACVETGTRGSIPVLGALRMRTSIRLHHNDDHPRLAASIKRMRAAFMPDDRVWEARAIRDTTRIFHHAAAALQNGLL
jgi:hypothetical protein